MARSGEDLTLGQLRTFVCVAHSGSFVKAADVLGISQPAVSEQVSLLEERLGYPLFHRRRGTTPILTKDGMDVLDKANRIIKAIEGLVKDAGSSSQRPVTLNVSIGPRLRESYLKPLLPRIYREHPEIQIDSQPLIPFPEIGKALQQGQIDLAIYTVATNTAAWIKELVPVSNVAAVLVAPVGTGRDLASGKKSLEDFQFLFPGDRDVVEAWAATVFAELGIRPRLEPVYFQLADVVLQLVEDGQGVSVLMQETVMESVQAGKIEIVECRLPGLQRIIGRSPHAPEEARIIEDYLSKALLKGCGESMVDMAC